MLCGSLDRKGVLGRMDTCICMAESLCCSPETITTLLIGCTPIQNKKFKDKWLWSEQIYIPLGFSGCCSPQHVAGPVIFCRLSLEAGVSRSHSL